MLGLSPPMWAALRDAPVRWQRVPYTCPHRVGTREALDRLHWIHHRINLDDGRWEWRVTAKGLRLRNADAKLKH
jgi:hypothetical protein